MSTHPPTVVFLGLALAGSLTARADDKTRPGAAPPQVQAVNPNVAAAGKLLPAVHIAMPNFAMVPGETRQVHATMTSAGKAVPNERIDFFVSGKAIGHATTDGSGKAGFDFKLPNTAQGSYEMLAKFGGDTSYRAGEAKSKLAVFLAMTETKIEFTTVANEGGHAPALPIFILHVTRKSDGAKLDVRLDVKVNGAVFKAPTGENPKTGSPNVFPGSRGPWKVEAQYNGDAYTQASADTKTHP